MKILQINAVNGMRSTGRQTKELADFINNNGHEGYVAYSEGVPYYNGFQIGKPIEKKAHAFFSRAIGKQAYYSKSGTLKLIEYMRALNPDVVHLHNLHANYINLEMILGYLEYNDIPTVITLHDCWFYTGKCTHYTVDRCNKWENQCGSCPRLRKDNKSWFFDYTSKMLEDKKEWFGSIPRLAVVGVSDWITNEAQKSILSSANVTKRIYNWIDLNTFKPVDYGLKKDELGIGNKFVLLGVASEWSDAKGLNTFIELANKLGEDKIIILVGTLSETIKLPNNIINISETNDIEELVTIYSMSDVFINLSKEESFGKVTAEALACGTPVITNSFTANPELIDHKCGYIINDLNDITKILEEIQEKGKKHYSEFCVEHARNNFDSNDRMSEYLNLYSLLIE